MASISSSFSVPCSTCSLLTHPISSPHYSWVGLHSSSGNAPFALKIFSSRMEWSYPEGKTRIRAGIHGRANIMDLCKECIAKIDVEHSVHVIPVEFAI